jgi:hypothetical protein
MTVENGRKLYRRQHPQRDEHGRRIVTAEETEDMTPGEGTARGRMLYRARYGSAESRATAQAWLGKASEAQSGDRPASVSFLLPPVDQADNVTFGGDAA